MKLKYVGYGILSIIGFLALLFFLNAVGIAQIKIFGVAREDAKREVFEETKSYVHGKIQDLARYYKQYQTSKSDDDKESIRSFIIMEFGEFDSKKIKEVKLRSFLIQMRGF